MDMLLSSLTILNLTPYAYHLLQKGTAGLWRKKLPSGVFHLPYSVQQLEKKTVYNQEGRTAGFPAAASNRTAIISELEESSSA